MNKCNYCHAVHSQTAVALGIGANMIANMFSNSREKYVDGRMRPILAFARKLTLSPASITAADSEEVFAAGWNDRALHDAVSICALFNLMNRLVNGLGIEAPEAYTKLAAQRLAEGGYAQLLGLLPASK